MVADTGTPDDPAPTTSTSGDVPPGDGPAATRTGPWAMPGVGAGAGSGSGPDSTELPTSWSVGAAPPGSPLPPVPGSPGSERRPRLALVITGVVVVVALVAVAALALLPGDESDDADGSEGASNSETTGDTTPPAESELEEVVAEISEFVEEERGLEFREPVVVELEDDEAFQARLFEDFEEDVAEIETYEPLYKALGMVEPDGDLAADLREAYSAGVVGFYDSETKELVVRGGALTPFVRVTIAHELTHALDDQHFGLHRPEYDEANDEIGFGFTALAEGVATRMEEVYMDELSDDEREQYFDELNDLAGGVIPPVSLVLLQLITAPYDVGPGFVEALLDDGGQERLDAAYDEPPPTSEQVLVPEAYLEGEAAVDVPHPTPDGRMTEEGVLGQIAVQLLLTDRIPLDDAEEAADGWGGDWSVSWTDGTQACVRFTMVGDTPDDTSELRDAWSDWGETMEGRGLAVDVQQPAEGQPFTLTSCTT